MHYVSYFIVLLLTILARTTTQMLRSEFRQGSQQQDSSLVKKWPTGPVRYISEILTHHYERECLHFSPGLFIIYIRMSVLGSLSGLRRSWPPRLLLSSSVFVQQSTLLANKWFSGLCLCMERSRGGQNSRNSSPKVQLSVASHTDCAYVHERRCFLLSSDERVCAVYLCRWSRRPGWSRLWAVGESDSARCEPSWAATTSPRCGTGWWLWCWAASLHTACVYSYTNTWKTQIRGEIDKREICNNIFLASVKYLINYWTKFDDFDAQLLLVILTTTNNLDTHFFLGKINPKLSGILKSVVATAVPAFCFLCSTCKGVGGGGVRQTNPMLSSTLKSHLENDRQ